VVGLLLVAGCAHQSARTVQAEAQGPYRIGREDVLDISVWRDPDLSRLMPVRPDGYISLPMAGEVLADGKTVDELADDIRLKLAPYVQKPQVTVIVHEINSSKVYVTGEVAHPGAYPLRGRVSVLQAVALAGGLSEFANSGGIVVMRPGFKDGPIDVNYGDLMKAKEFQLRPGDTVVVP
jgi:polysaccharide export outer membrane protein